MPNPLVIDLFRGPGGWSEGLRLLGLTDYGVEFDQAAHDTATAAGHDGILADVLDLDPLELLKAVAAHYGIPLRELVLALIASPPCQTFSMAGGGAGRRALDEVLLAVKCVAAGQAVPTFDDPRTALVVQPLRWALELEPEWTAWEQVPTVLPVWEACAEVLRADGYSVATGLLHAEEYGVPQTRKRAVLVASRTRKARLPTPTHTRYRKGKPRQEPGRLPWVSMADALGWGATIRPSMTVTGGGAATGGAEPFGNEARRALAVERDEGRWMVAAGVTGEGRPRHGDDPAPTMTGKGTAYVIEQESNYSGPGAPGASAADRGLSRRGIDTPSHTVTSKAHKWLASGTRANAVLRRGDEPASTLAFGNDAASYAFVPEGTEATEVPELKRASSAVRVSVEEAALLQTFPADYPWQGNKGKRYQQVGNAVPPLLAAHIIAALTGVDPPEPRPFPPAPRPG